MSGELTFEDILKHIDKEEEHFVIKLETHHGSGREVTVIQPHRPSKDDAGLRDLAKQLKETLGTGGDVENGRIVLHGDLRNQAQNELVKLGFKDENIEVV